MSNTEKKKIVDDILELLIQLTDDGAEMPSASRESAPKPVEIAHYQRVYRGHSVAFCTHCPPACEAGQGEVRPHRRGQAG